MKESTLARVLGSSSPADPASRLAELVAAFPPESLPSLPAVALQVVHAAGRPDCTAAEVTELIAQDPALAARLLRAVNSCVYGLTNPVPSLERAVHVLGLNPLRSLVLGLALPAVQPAGPGDPTTRGFWLASVSGAILARELSARRGGSTPEDDLVAGLLRDLGRVVLRRTFPDRYRELVDEAGCRLPDQLVRAERAAFGFDHAEVTAYLLETWSLPAEIVEPVRHHHDPDGARGAAPPVRDRAQLLGFVEELVQLDAVADSAPRLARLLTAAQDRYGFTRPELVEFLRGLGPKFTEFAALLDVDVSKFPDFAGIMAAGAASLVGLTIEANRQKLSGTVANPPRRAPAAETRVAAGAATPRPAATVKQTGSAITLLPAGEGEGDGAAPDDFLTLLDGHPRYHVLGRLGEGGMGTVYRAEHRLMNRTVAIKVVSPEWTADRATAERFRREVRLAARLNHPNIVTAHDADEIAGRQCLVMEFVDGPTLDRVVARDGPLPVAAACRLVRQAAAGLQYAFEQGMVHRDIKPHNLIVAADGRVKILDFGLARMARPDTSRGLTRREYTLGTPDYMPPEQFRNPTAVDQRSDLYALGCTLFYLLTGRPPFGDRSSEASVMVAHLERTPPRLAEFRSDVPAGLQAVLDRLLAKEPSARYQTPALAAAALEPFESSDPAPARAPFARWAVGLGLALAAALVGAAAWAVLR